MKAFSATGGFVHESRLRYAEEHELTGIVMTVCATGYFNPETRESMTQYRTMCQANMATIDQCNTLITLAREVYLLACAAEEMDAQRDITRAACSDVVGGMN